MDRIIKYAHDRIDACVHCQARYGCEWFKAAGQVVLDYPPEQYAQMTYEEISNAIHADIIEPDENCDQVSFDGMMQAMDEMLQEASIPQYSDSLRKLLQKMVQLERRLNRLPSDCREVFDAPIRAIVERCLGAVDYAYLDMGLDIFLLIENIHGDYHRTKILRQYHIEGVVNVLLAKAYRMSVEEIIGYYGPFREFTPPKPAFVPVPDFSDLDLPENLPGKAAPDDPTIEEPTIIGDTESSKPYVPSATETFLGMMNHSDTGDYVFAVTMSFGIDETSFPWDEKDEFDTDFIAKHIVPPFIYEFPKMKEVAQEIRKEVKKRKKNEEELQLYMNGLLYDIGSLGHYLFPSWSDDAHTKLSLIFDLSKRFSGYSLQDFSNIWENVVEDAGQAFEVGSEEYYNHIFQEMYRVEQNPFLDTSDRTLTGIAELRKLCSQFEAAIESALLLNNIKHDFMYFESECRAYLGWEVSEDDVAEYAGLTKTAVKRLAKTLGHNFKYVPPVENIEDELPDFSVASDLPSTEPEKKPATEEPIDPRPKLDDCVPVALITNESRPYWLKARDEGFLDINFKYTGQKNEMALFASKISLLVFKEIRWVPFKKWANYEYFSKAYGEVPQVSEDKLPDNFKKIVDFFK